PRLGFTTPKYTRAATWAAQQPPPPAATPLAGGGRGVDPDALRVAYPGANPTELAGQAISDTIIRGPSYRIAEARAARNLPTWLYEFEWTATSPSYQGMAAHCLDLPFAFDLLHASGVTEAEGAAPPQALADAVHSSWVAFVKETDPGRDWPRYTLEQRQAMIWSTHSQVRADAFAAQRRLWLT
ncbi:carboxylesterase family protein, partial [Nocardia brasiliensis]|uniref:carboxylesterase family protein n=1 Tax=Nocardia brasiliensis TaxID=37326 RepID=UPI002455D484